MPVTLPSGQVGRLLALGLTIVVLALVWLALVAPLIGWHAERAEQLAQQRILALRMETLAQSLPELRRAAGATAPGTENPKATSLLDGTTDAVAAASLQQLVQDMASSASANLSSTETLQVIQVSSYRRIGLHVAVSAPWTVLIKLFQAIAQASPRMVVDDFQVHGQHFVVPPPDPPLDASFSVFAFRASVVPASSR